MLHKLHIFLTTCRITTLILLQLAAPVLIDLGAEEYALPIANDNPDFQVFVEIEGHEAKPFGAVNTTSSGYTVLYTASGKLSVRVSAYYTGSLPDGVTLVETRLEMSASTNNAWAVDGSTASQEMDMQTVTNLNRLVFLNGSVRAITDNPNIQPACSFSAVADVFKPYSVSVYASTSAGNLYGTASSVKPFFRTNTVTGMIWADVDFTPASGVSIRFESAEGATIGNNGWMTTDENGRVLTEIAAPLDSADANGEVHATIFFKAVKGAFQLEKSQPVNLLFAIVTDAVGAQLVPAEGEIGVPYSIYSGQKLVPGNIVQVGDKVATDRMFIAIRFCNGDMAILTAESISAVRATVGKSGLGPSRSVLVMDLRNLSYNVSADPRRYGRLVIANVLGNLLDDAIGIPNPVGWVSATPGSMLEDWIIELFEGRSRSLRKQTVPFAAATPALSRSNPRGMTTLDLFSDGTVAVNNHGADIQVSGPTASRVLPRSGTVLINNRVPGGAPSDVGLASPLPANSVKSMILTPADGATNVSRTPKISLTINAGAAYELPIMPDSFVCRLDGRLLSTGMAFEKQFNSMITTCQIAVEESLAPGAHYVEAEGVAGDGSRLQAHSTFFVTADVTPPDHIFALAGKTNVVLYWTVNSVAPGGFRVYRNSNGTSFTALNATKPTKQMVYVDKAPAPRAKYAVAAINEFGVESPLSEMVEASYPGSASPNITVTNLTASIGADSISLSWQNPSMQLGIYRIERASGASGPYEDMLMGEHVFAQQWTDKAIPASGNYWYRISPLTIDGVAGLPMVIGPVSWTKTSGYVVGVVASYHGNSTVRLSWNPLAEASGYRIYRSNGVSRILAATVSASTNSWWDTGLPGGIQYSWNIAALLPGDNETILSSTVTASWMAAPQHPGLIEFSPESQQGNEGEIVRIPVIRSAGSDGPAFVRYTTWSFLGNDTASSYDDFTPVGGTLVFNTGETQKWIEIELARDAYFEKPEETFTVEIKSVEGGPVLGSNFFKKITIANTDVLRWQNTWYYAQEGMVSNISVSAERLNPSTNLVTVEYYFDAEYSSAMPGSDFVAVPDGVLTFLPGETAKSFMVSLLNDTNKEPNLENIRFRMRNATGGAAIDTSDPFQLSATIQLSDDDLRPGRLAFSTNRLSGAEGQTLQVTINRLEGADGMMMGWISPGGGTASMGEDIGPLDMLIFNDGETQKVLNVALIADQQPETSESIWLVLDGHGGSYAGPPKPSLAMLVIQGDLPESRGYPAWASNTLATASSADRLPLANPDGDGMPNWAEYLFNTNPAQSNIAPGIRLEISSYGQAQFSEVYPDTSEFNVIAEFSSSLDFKDAYQTSGSWSSATNGFRRIVFSDLWSNEKMRFARLRLFWLGE